MVPMIFLKHFQWWKHWELLTFVGNNSVGQQHMCGGMPDPLALWRSTVWTSPSGPLYSWSQRKEGGSSRTELISSLNSHLKWMRWTGSLGVSISLCNGNAQGLLTQTRPCTQQTWMLAVTSTGSHTERLCHSLCHCMTCPPSPCLHRLGCQSNGWPLRACLRGHTPWRVMSGPMEYCCGKYSPWVCLTVGQKSSAWFLAASELTHILW